MKIDFLVEPELEFGNGGNHVDVRFGIMQNGPFDRGFVTAPSQLKVGIVGTEETIEGVHTWLQRTGKGIQAKDSRLSNLFPPFPGFSENSCFGASLVFHDRWFAPINSREIERMIAASESEQLVYDAVELFVARIADISQPGGPMVIICAPPSELLAALEADASNKSDPVDEELDEGSDPRGTGRSEQPHFHDLLKADGMRVNTPIQMVRPDTYGIRQNRRKKNQDTAPRSLQDEATRAWNFHTALYYKAGGIPWRLIRNPSKLAACFIGISFYKTIAGDRILTSVAQVFNERGEGVIVKGGNATIDKDDHQPHLSEMDANTLMKHAFQTYRREHKTLPARVVIHKTSGLNDAETEGFRSAAEEERIDTLELLSMRRSFSRLFREGTYPPLRGTFLELDETKSLLYLRGSVNFFEAYPGLYVPRPLEFSVKEANSTSRHLAQEIFELSKLNWNNTQFDGGEPITVRAARRVGDILKCVSVVGSIQPSFRFFM
jgi:hypothetical protein